MAKPKISLKLGLMTTIVICWLVPIIIIVTLAGILFGDNYRRSVRQEMDASADYALRQVQVLLGDAINVYAEYAFNLMSGAVNPDTVLPEFLSKLEAAGINEFVATAQAQLEAYMG